VPRPAHGVGADGASSSPAVKAPLLTDIDLAYGTVLGEIDGARPISRRRPAIMPRAALEEALGRALRRPPCLVSFSGGLDSSSLLAVATQLARREGYALPIPATLRFPGSHDADEDEWQTLVIGHLGLVEWLRITVDGDELDLVGPVAAAAMRRHGLLWPCNAHFHAPIVAAAAHGSVVTGFGGDELAVLSATSRAERVLACRARPRLTDALVVGLAVSPRPVRTWVHARRARLSLQELPWLTDVGVRHIARAVGASVGSDPLGWSRTIRHQFPRDRYIAVCAQSLAALGADHDVEVVHPFVDPVVLDALAGLGGFAGLGFRADLVRTLFGDVLPSTLLGRSSKASFDDALVTSTARRFAAAWSGGGVTSDLVDVEALRRHWSSGEIDGASLTLLQAAWIHDDSARHGATQRTAPPT